MAAALMNLVTVLTVLSLGDCLMFRLHPQRIEKREISAIRASVLPQRLPVILVPPMLGSFIQGKLTNAQMPHLFCPRNADWSTIWYPPAAELMPGIVDCWVQAFSLAYNATTDVYTPNAGVQTRVITALDSLIGNGTDGNAPGAYVDIAAALVSQFGYVPGKDLVGFPYDWRYGPAQYEIPGGIFAQMKVFFEQTYAANSNRRAIVISMSMGAPWFVDFLERYVNEAWKTQYIDTLFSLAGSFAGAAVALQNVLSPSLGWSDHTIPPSVDAAFMRLVRTLGSVSWMIPAAEFWNDTVIVATSAGVKYTAKDFGRLLREVGADTTALMWEKAKAFPNVGAPGVRTYIYYGYNVSTPIVYTYPAGNWSAQPAVQFADGDGTVALTSLINPPTAWRALQTQPIIMRPFFNLSHADVLFRSDAISALMQDIRAVTPPEESFVDV